MDVPQFTHLFSCGWTFELLPGLATITILVTSFSRHRLSFLLGESWGDRYLFWNFTAIPWSKYNSRIYHMCLTEAEIQPYDLDRTRERKLTKQCGWFFQPLLGMSVPPGWGLVLSDYSSWGVVFSPSAFPAHTQAISLCTLSGAFLGSMGLIFIPSGLDSNVTSEWLSLAFVFKFANYFCPALGLTSCFVCLLLLLIT